MERILTRVFQELSNLAVSHRRMEERLLSVHDEIRAHHLCKCLPVASACLERDSYGTAEISMIEKPLPEIEKGTSDKYVVSANEIMLSSWESMSGMRLGRSVAAQSRW